jgi:hypothetical protein
MSILSTRKKNLSIGGRLTKREEASMRTQPITHEKAPPTIISHIRRLSTLRTCLLHCGCWWWKLWGEWQLYRSCDEILRANEAQVQQ